MFNNEGKTAFIESLFEQIPVDSNNSQAMKVIRTFLLQNTNQGKLYKFRAVNEHSLSDLINGTLYCATPSSFNDPFDCQVGIDFQSYFTARYEEALRPIDLYLGKFIQVYEGSLQLNECSEKERSIFTKWENNPNLMTFLKKYRGSNVDEEQIAQLFGYNFQIVIDIMSAFMSDENLSVEMHAALNIMSKLIESMSQEGKIAITKSDATYEDFAKSLGVNADADEIGLTRLIYESQHPEDFATAVKLDEDFKKINNDLSRAIDNMFRVGCLCTDYKNRLMWSHYANGHKGFCVEYDFGIEDNNVLSDILILPVVYSNRRPKFPWTVAIATDKNSSEIKTEGAKRMMQSLLTKDEAWSYEDEWRIITLCSTGKDKIKMPKISCIYIGALCSENDKEKITRIANGIGAHVKQMTVDRGEYKIHANSLVSYK